ncbi:HD domain-containing phosphohydrolase [Limnothrix redekei LRLZ20PSL1]|uniref:HD domain-containing phosphohydrolase n=1 Tax=Limnothrix redekei LRLZ20PSL1 TaxID=3112953 RepID=A0ABW7CBI0_9CYAN
MLSSESVNSVSIWGERDFLQEAASQASLVEELLAIATALSAVSDLDELLALILTTCRELTWSDAGSVYLIDRSDDTPKLIFKVAQNASQPNASFREFAMPLARRSLAGYVALTGKSLSIPDAYCLPAGVPYQFNHNFDSGFSYRTRSVIVVPMQNLNGETIGVLQLINRKTDPRVIVDPWNAMEVTRPYTEWEERVVQALASLAAISIERSNLQESIEALFEGFVRAAVQAIESRDPCTSGHSERVATLAVRLCEVVNEIHTGPLAATYFTPRQIQEIRYASLLHDFGKVCVPEAVLVKQKKLYPDQLEVIRHRFALARRTLELDCLQVKYRYWVEHPELLTAYQSRSSAPESSNGASSSGASKLAESNGHELAAAKATQTMAPHNPHTTIANAVAVNPLDRLDSELTAALDELDQYWTLLLEANEPQVLEAEPLAQLQELASYTYRDVDGQQKPLVTAAEIEQLTVPRGTLTSAERSAIQSHVTHTYQFLNRIPWTSYLRQVPEIAYGHHEKLDGSGYPRGLQAGEIPIQTRIMSIADVYDALTAADRPYKRAISTSSALTILRQEAQINRLDSVLVSLFEEKAVYQAIGHALDHQLLRPQSALDGPFWS